MQKFLPTALFVLRIAYCVLRRTTHDGVLELTDRRGPAEGRFDPRTLITASFPAFEPQIGLPAGYKPGYEHPDHAGNYQANRPGKELIQMLNSKFMHRSSNTGQAGEKEGFHLACHAAENKSKRSYWRQEPINKAVAGKFEIRISKCETNSKYK